MAVLRLLTLNVGSLFEEGWDRRRHEVVAWIDRDALRFDRLRRPDR